MPVRLRQKLRRTVFFLKLASYLTFKDELVRQSDEARKSEDWRPLVDAFRNREIEFDISLVQLQIFYATFKIIQFKTIQEVQ